MFFSVRDRGWRPGKAAPLTPSSFRLLVVASVAIAIWVIWLSGMLGDSRAVTMLSLSEVSLLGTGLVVELRRRYRAEEAIRESEQRYRFLSDHSSDMIVRFDPRTQRRTYVSPACRRLYGYEPEEAITIPAEEIIHPDDLPAVNEALSRLEQDAAHSAIVYRGRHRDGTYVWVEASLTRLTDRDTGSIEIVSIVRDVSERVRHETELCKAKEAADAANQAKSCFLATMSHELRTPLNAIIGFSDMMKNQIIGPIGSMKYRYYANDIHDSGTHLLKLINDILDLTKIEAGKFELYEEVLDLAEVIDSVLRITRSQIVNTGLSVGLHLPSSLPLLRADERQTRQVLFNLVGNSVKFTQPGGRIDISVSFNPHVGLRISVADTGIGIAPIDLPRVFEPFGQVDGLTNRQHDGTGLGLPVAKGIMELHGGALELTSTLGAGTEASAIFPPGRIIASDRSDELMLPAA